jgi:hypothetical protein
MMIRSALSRAFEYGSIIQGQSGGGEKGFHTEESPVVQLIQYFKHPGCKNKAHIQDERFQELDCEGMRRGFEEQYERDVFKWGCMAGRYEWRAKAVHGKEAIR